MASWGNAADNRNNQHMESPNGYHLKVTDANENGPALYAKNSNAGASARALKVEGVSELIGDTQATGNLTVDGQASVTSVINGADGINIIGESDLHGDVVVDGILHAGGTTELVGWH